MLTNSSDAYAYIKLTGGTPYSYITATKDGVIDGCTVFSSKGIAYIPVSGPGEYKVEGYTTDQTVYNIKDEHSIVSVLSAEGGVTIDVPSFADGSIEDIKNALTYIDSGLLPYNVFPVGAERAISIDGVDYIWTIYDTGINSSYTFSDGTPVHYIVGLKNCLTRTRQLNASGLNNGSWNGSDMRKYCNGDFKNSVFNSFNLFKQFKTITVQVYNGNTNQTSIDYFALPAEKEVFGNQTFSNNTEASALKQFKLFETSESRIKGLGDSGEAQWWWVRSPDVNTSNSFCGVSAAGTISRADANKSSGVSPFGCI